MASADKSEERVFLLELIKLYESLPALWNTSCSEYTNRLKKHQSYNILLAKYCQRYPSATKLDLKKKINALRTNYRKIKQKYSDADVRTSKCWYYEEISFLEEKDPAQQTSIVSFDDIKFPPQQQESPRLPKKARLSETIRDQPSVSPFSLTEQVSEQTRIAWVWGNELAKASDEQQIYAKKAINDVLFEAQMGTLTRHSVSINDSPPIMHYYTQKGQE